MKLTKTLIFLLFLCFSCTNNERVRNFGGTENIDLPEDHKFINITWKQDDLWVLSQDTITGIFYLKEKSSYGLLEGTIIIQ